jgi:hypothetical protein
MQTTEPHSPPPSYQPHFADKARRFCLLGMTDEELAREFRVTLETLMEWRQSVPSFEDNIWEGRRLADGNMADGLYRLGIGCSHDAVRIFMPAGAKEPVIVPYTRHYPPDGPTGRYWLNNRRSRDWRAKVEVKAAQENDTLEYSDGELTAIVAQDSGEGPPGPTGGPH